MLRHPLSAFLLVTIPKHQPLNVKAPLISPAMRFHEGPLIFPSDPTKKFAGRLFTGSATDAIVNNKVKDHGNNPYFVREAEEAQEIYGDWEFQVKRN